MSYLRRSQVSPQRQTPQDQFNQSGYGQTVQSTYLPQTTIGSPVKSYDEGNQSGYQQATNNETEVWKNRYQGLEGTLQQKEGQLEVAASKARRADNLEQQVESAKKNNVTLSENADNLKRSLTQKSTECDIWKQKYEKEVNQKITQKSNADLAIKRLQDELAQVKDDMNRNNVQSYKEIQDSKADVSMQAYNKVNNLKSEHCEDLSLYEEQLRKLREIIEDREKQIAILNQKLETSKNETQLDKVRADEEYQKLQTRLSLLEVENNRNKELQQAKNDNNHNSEVENLRTYYKNEIDVHQGENQKLKDLLELKTKEIASLINQNKAQKANNEEEQNSLRAEIQELKDKIYEINASKLEEIDNLKASLESQHENDIQGLRFHHENQIDALEKEIEKLHEMIESKTQQIDDQIKEKLEQRQNYNDECERLNGVIDGLKDRQQELENDLAEQKRVSDEEISNMRVQHQVAEEQFNRQNQELEKSLNELKLLLESKDQDLLAEREQHHGIQDGLKSEIQVLTEQNEDWEKKYGDLVHQTEDIIEGLKLDLNVARNEAAEQAKKDGITIDSQAQEIEKLNRINEVKTSENENLQINKAQLEEEIAKLRNDVEVLQDNLIQCEKSKNQELQDLRVKLEQSHEFAIQSTKQTFDNQTNIMEGEIQDLNLRLQLKDKEFQTYIEKYNKMEAIIQDFVNHPEKLRDRSDVVSTKNLYDVLKSSNRSPVKRTYSPIKNAQYY